MKKLDALEKEVNSQILGKRARLELDYDHDEFIDDFDCMECSFRTKDENAALEHADDFEHALMIRGATTGKDIGRVLKIGINNL